MFMNSIKIGWCTTSLESRYIWAKSGIKTTDELYALDPTNPGAQEYHQVYLSTPW